MDLTQECGLLSNPDSRLTRSSVVLKEIDTNILGAEGGYDFCPVSAHMKALLQEFGALYEDRLRRLEFESGGGTQEERLLLKIQILQAYVKDLSDQNQVLAQTVEDLEKEANKKRRLSHLDNGLTVRTLCMEPLEDSLDNNGQSQKPKDIIQVQVDHLQSELKAKDRIIQNLREEMKRLHAAAPDKNELHDQEDAVHLLKLQLEALQNLQMEKVSQIAARDITITRLRADLQIAQQDASKEQNQLSIQVRTVHEAKETVKRLKDELMAKDAQCETFWQSRKDLQEKVLPLTVPLEAELTVVKNGPTEDYGNKLLEQEERVRQTNEDLANMKEKLLSARQEINEPKKGTGQMQLEVTSHKATEDSFSTRQCLGCQQNKASEEKVERLTLEIDLLKSKLQEKTEQTQELQDRLLKQQEALSRANETLKETKKAASCKISRKENKLVVMQKELQGVKALLSECQNERLLGENLLQKLKEEAAHLTSQIKAQSQDISKLNNERQELEVEMTVVMERQRAAQQEVSNRDQVIVQMQGELKMRAEKLSSTQKELGLHRTEVEQLSEKLRKLQERYRQGEECLQQEERQHVYQQLLSAHEQIEVQLKTIQQLNSASETSKQEHIKDLEVWNKKFEVLQAQLVQTRKDLRESESKAQEHKQKVVELELKVQEAEEQVRKQHVTIEEIQTELSHCKLQAKNHEASAANYKQKYQSAMERLLGLEGQRHEEEVQYAQCQASQTLDIISALQAELLNMEKRYDEKCVQMETLEETLEQVMHELQTVRDSLSLSEDQVSGCELLITKLKEYISGQEKAFLQLQEELAAYQANHTSSNQQHEELQKHCTLLQQEMDSLKQQRSDCANREAELQRTVRLLQHTLESLHLQAASVQQDHRVAIAQLEQEASQLKVDLAEARKSLQKREELLQKWQADLLQAREAARGSALEQQRCEGALEELRAAMQALEEKKSKKEQENQGLGAAVKQLERALRDLRRRHTNTAQELAGREEKILQLQANLRVTQEEMATTQEELARCRLQADTRQRHQLELEHDLTEQAIHQLRQDKKKLTEQLHQTQRACQENIKDLANTEEQLVLLNTEFEELQVKFQCKVREVERLKAEQGSLRGKLEAANAEVEAQQRVTSSAQAENSRLLLESKQLVANISHWIREHKTANKSLSVKIKEQNKLLAFVTTENNRLQKARDAMQEELGNLRAVTDEKDKQIKHLKALHSSSANQPIVLNQLQGHVAVKDWAR